VEVKILKSIASEKFSFRPGQVTSIEADLARKWQSIGICEPVFASGGDVDVTNLLNEPEFDKAPVAFKSAKKTKK
jgi:hypothetical protein